MTFVLRLRTLRLPLRDPFVIARSSHGEGQAVTTVIATLRDDADGPDGPLGIGEGYPDPYYGDTPETMAAVAPLLLASIDPIATDLRGSAADVRAALEDAEGLMAAAIAHHGAIKCAIDIALHEQVAALVAPSKVVAVALNTSLIPDEEEARRIVAATALETGLPCDDPVRFGGDPLWREIEAAVDGLPWVTLADQPGSITGVGG